MTKEYTISNVKPLNHRWINETRFKRDDGTDAIFNDGTLVNYSFDLSNDHDKKVSILTFKGSSIVNGAIAENNPLPLSIVIPEVNESVNYLGIFNQDGGMIATLRREVNSNNSWALMQCDDNVNKHDEERKYVMDVFSALTDVEYSLRELTVDGESLKLIPDENWKQRVDANSLCKNDESPSKACAYRNFAEARKMRHDWNTVKIGEEIKGITITEDKYDAQTIISFRDEIDRGYDTDHQYCMYHIRVSLLLQKDKPLVLYIGNNDLERRPKMLLQKDSDGKITAKSLTSETSFAELFYPGGNMHKRIDYNENNSFVSGGVLIGAGEKEKSGYCYIIRGTYQNYLSAARAENFDNFVKKNYFSHDFATIRKQLPTALMNCDASPKNNARLLDKLKESEFIKITDHSKRTWKQFFIDLFFYIFSLENRGVLIGEGTIEYNKDFKIENLTKLMTVEELRKGAVNSI